MTEKSKTPVVAHGEPKPDLRKLARVLIALAMRQTRQPAPVPTKRPKSSTTQRDRS